VEGILGDWRWFSGGRYQGTIQVVGRILDSGSRCRTGNTRQLFGNSSSHTGKSSTFLGSRSRTTGDSSMLLGSILGSAVKVAALFLVAKVGMPDTETGVEEEVPRGSPRVEACMQEPVMVGAWAKAEAPVVPSDSSSERLTRAWLPFKFLTLLNMLRR
jgi:hypothetical protein